MSLLNGPRVLCMSLLLVFVAFLAWYDRAAAPLSAVETERYIETITARAQAAGQTPDPLLLEELRRLAASDDGDEFYMQNLINYRAQAQYPSGSPYSGTGMEADARYTRGILPLLFKHGGHPVYLGDVQGRFIDAEGDTQWQRSVLVRYRSRRDLLEMVVALASEPVGVHKWASIEKTQVFPTRPVINLMSARGLVAGLLTAIGLILHGLLRNRRFYSGLKH